MAFKPYGTEEYTPTNPADWPIALDGFSLNLPEATGEFGTQPTLSPAGMVDPRLHQVSVPQYLTQTPLREKLQDLSWLSLGQPEMLGMGALEIARQPAKRILREGFHEWAKNKFGMPFPDIVKRYRQMGSKMPAVVRDEVQRALDQSKILWRHMEDIPQEVLDVVSTIENKLRLGQGNYGDYLGRLGRLRLATKDAPHYGESALHEISHAIQNYIVDKAAGLSPKAKAKQWIKEVGGLSAVYQDQMSKLETLRAVLEGMPPGVPGVDQFLNKAKNLWYSLYSQQPIEYMANLYVKYLKAGNSPAVAAKMSVTDAFKHSRTLRTHKELNPTVVGKRVDAFIQEYDKFARTRNLQPFYANPSTAGVSRMAVSPAEEVAQKVGVKFDGSVDYSKHGMGTLHQFTDPVTHSSFVTRELTPEAVEKKLREIRAQFNR